MNIDTESARDRQARVQKSGRNWEKYVKSLLEDKLERTDIKILWEKEAKNRQELARAVFKLANHELSSFG